MGEIFNAMREDNKRRREENLAKANPEGWTQHTEYHWSRTLNGKRLDYYPSKNKFVYNGTTSVGNVENFIKKTMAEIYDFSSGRKRDNHNEQSLAYTPLDYHKARVRLLTVKLNNLHLELEKMTIWQRIFCWKWGK